jgi:REP element-mobilizing transposase RayT
MDGSLIFWRMPKPRRLLLSHARGETGQYFHLVSRVVNRGFVFEDAERERFAQIMRDAETFSGVRVLSWTILSNHFHLLIYVPEKPTDYVISDAEFWHRLKALYTEEEVVEIRSTFRSIRKETSGTTGEIMARQYRQKFLDRMLDLSEFMKSLKLRFTLWFNRRHSRVGTLWEARFKSVLVEGDESTLAKVSAYIDLNAVRAGMVKDPKDYRWCGYGEAIGSSKQSIRTLARNALQAVMNGIVDNPPTLSIETKNWRALLTEYRKLLYGIGDETDSAKGGFTQSDVEAIMKAGGTLTLAQMLRCRIRHLTDGLVIGSRSFVDDYFDNAKLSFGAQRKSGARKIKGADTDGLYSMRDLKKSTLYQFTSQG